MITHPADCRCRRHDRAFTLIELMVSIALVLILVLGINQVFRIASQGVGAGQALSTATRDIRATPAVFNEDLRHVRMPARTPSSGGELGPAFVIRSERRYAYRNRPEHLGDPDGSPLDAPTNAEIRGRDLDGDGVVSPLEDTPPAVYNDRSHRLDTMTFFVSGELYYRQTGGSVANANDVFVADQNSLEAMITYGHLSMPDFTTADGATPEGFKYREPGPHPQDRSIPPDTNQALYSKNVGNFYASDWALGRTVFLLTSGVDTSGDGVADRVDDRNGTEQRFYARGTAIDLLNANNLDPFAGDVNSPNKGAPTNNATKSADGWPLAAARYDVLGVSMSDARNIFRNYALAGGPWWNQLTNFRYHASPVIVKPVNAAAVAKATPIFLRGCTQFMIEYAGDFVTQNNDPADTPLVTATDTNTANGRYGDVLSIIPATGPPNVNGPDGVPDFVVLTDVNGTTRKVTRWYGLPRDTYTAPLDTQPVVLGWIAGRHNNEMPDVVPLRDVGRTALNPTTGAPDAALAGYAPEFERYLGGTQDLPLPVSGNYVADMGPDAVYLCAWGPDTGNLPAPSMLRITVALDEPSGAMAGEQTYEQVITLP
jgi:prepilin-type N-terminal cleavage/methylation domain-containing protein